MANSFARSYWLTRPVLVFIVIDSNVCVDYWFDTELLFRSMCSSPSPGIASWMTVRLLSPWVAVWFPVRLQNHWITIYFLNVFCTVHCNATVQYKPTKYAFVELILSLFTMCSTCFEPEGSSSGRRLYVQLWYKLLTCKGISRRRRKNWNISLIMVYFVGLYCSTIWFCVRLLGFPIAALCHYWVPKSLYDSVCG